MIISASMEAEEVGNLLLELFNANCEELCSEEAGDDVECSLCKYRVATEIATRATKATPNGFLFTEVWNSEHEQEDEQC